MELVWQQIIPWLVRRLVRDTDCAVASESGSTTQTFICPGYRDTPEPMQWYCLTLTPCDEPPSVTKAREARIDEGRPR